ncbi:uncharacterized protein LOC135392725 [Ornithodoros turicata]|uniref:uncharacterized protein LOC135392725 n=1 Tax=Ornithodoros turicata TaxID=34597 RepID=UPI0031388629
MSTRTAADEAKGPSSFDLKDDGESSRIDLHPVTSEGFSAFSISEDDLIKDLIRVKECLEASVGAMQNGDGEQKEKGSEEITVDVPQKPAKDEANRELRFQIMQDPSRSGSGSFKLCQCKRRQHNCKRAHRKPSGHRCSRRVNSSHDRPCNCPSGDRSSSRSSRRSYPDSCRSCSHKSADMPRPEKKGGGSRKDGRRQKTTVTRTRQDEDAPDMFRRYRSSYSSSESYSEEEERTDQEYDLRNDESNVAPEDERKKDRKRIKGTTKYEGSKYPDGRTRVEGRSKKQYRKMDRNNLEEATFEKHVLELNFPKSPGMTSISNLLQQRRDEEDEGEDEQSPRKFVHQIRPGQTCELQTEGQVIRVRLPEKNKMTVEHVIQPREDAQEMDERRFQQTGERRRQRKKNAIQEADEIDSGDDVCSEKTKKGQPAYRCAYKDDRKDSSKRSTPRQKNTLVRRIRDNSNRRGANKRSQCALVRAAKGGSESPSSSGSDSHEDNDIVRRRHSPPCKRNPRKGEGEKDVDDDESDDNVCFLSSLKNSRCHGRCGASRGPGEVGFSIRETRRVGRHRGEESDDDDVDPGGREVASPRTPRSRDGDVPRLKVSSTVSLNKDRNGRNGNSFRVVFTDSKLNTELRYILQDGHGTTRRQSNLIITTEDNSDQTRRCQDKKATAERRDGDPPAQNERRSQRGVAQHRHSDCTIARVKELSRRTPSDLISSSYYSSTHESSLVLNDKKKGCKVCDAVSAINKGSKRDVCLHDGKRHRRLHQHKR